MTDHAIEAAALAVWEIGAADDLNRQDAGYYARAAIRAYLAAMEAEAVFVPREPTMKMREEGLFANENTLLMSADCTDMANAYRAMLAARPKIGEG